MGTKFTQEFKNTLAQRGVRPHQLPKASPNLNGRCERFIQTIKHECLSKFIIFGQQHLYYLIDEFTTYYYNTRSSMVRDHLPPVREIPEEVEILKLDQIGVRRHVGGLVSLFELKNSA
jgi:putative transposase